MQCFRCFQACFTYVESENAFPDDFRLSGLEPLVQETDGSNMGAISNENNDTQETLDHSLLTKGGGAHCHGISR